MNEIDLPTLKTKNIKKDSIKLKPIHSPLLIEKQYKAFIYRLINSLFIELGKGLKGKQLHIDYDEIIKMVDSLNGSFDLQEIKDEATTLFDKVNGRNEKEIIGAVGEATGVSVGNFLLIYNSEIQDFLEKTVAQNVTLIKSIETDSLKDVKRIITDAHLQGSTIQNIKKLIFPLVKKDDELASTRRKMRHRAETIAITETAKANSGMTIKRFKSLNINKVMWSSARDKRTRRCHSVRHGAVYDIEKGCWSACDGRTIQTGQEIRCRCAMLGVVE